MFRKVKDAIARFVCRCLMVPAAKKKGYGIIGEYLLSVEGKRALCDALFDCDDYKILKQKVRFSSLLSDEDFKNINLPQEDGMSISSFFLGKENWYVGPMSVMYGARCSHIGENFRAGRAFRLEVIEEYSGQRFSPSLEIGDNVSIQDFCHIGCVERVEIGDGTMIASKVFITDHFHGDISPDDLKTMPAERPLSHKPVKIGRNVWIGDGACILPGVTLGDTVIVGANAVVTHSFEPNSVIAGCPARLIRKIEDNKNEEREV